MRKKTLQNWKLAGAISLLLPTLFCSISASYASQEYSDLYAATGKEPPAEADTLSGTLVAQTVRRRDVEGINDRILRTLIQMQRLNTRFRLESTSQPKMRQWRQSAYVLSNASCAIGGTVDAMRLHYPNIHRPATIFEIDKQVTASGQTREVLVSKVAAARRIRPALNQGIQEPQLVGNCINACGDVFELGANAIRYRQMKDEGYDPQTYRTRLLALGEELDAEMAQRAEMEKGLKPGSIELDVSIAEGQVQRDLRDLLLEEYSHYHSSATKLFVFQNAAYLLDFAKNTTGAAASIISMEGSHINHPRMSGGAGVFTTVSGALILMIPAAGRVAGNWASTVDRHILSRDYGVTMAQSTADAFRDRAKLVHAIYQTTSIEESNLLAPKGTVPVLPAPTSPAPPVSASAAQNSGGPLNSDPNVPQTQRPLAPITAEKLADASLHWNTRVYAYGQLCDIMRGHEQNIKRLTLRAKHATRENIIYGSTLGSTKVALGVCGILSGWRYYNKPWIASRLQAAGNTAYASGSAFAVLENSRILYTQQRAKHQMIEQQMLPEQLYRARLAKLDEVEKRIGNSDL